MGLQTAVNGLLLWALCSNTFSLNEAAQASLKAKFKPSLAANTAATAKLKAANAAAAAMAASSTTTAASGSFGKAAKSGLTAVVSNVRPQLPLSSPSTTMAETEAALIDLRGQ